AVKLIAPSVEKIADEPQDRFDRDGFGRGLLHLFTTSETPLVVALDENWGTGKTVFALRLARIARDAGYPVVYFDAFAKDYDPDIFVSLAASIIRELPKASEKASLKEKAKAVGKVLGR